MATMRIEISADKRKIVYDEIKKRVGEIRRNAIMKTMPKAVMKAEMILRTAVDSYYESYSPHLYNRTESLYSVMDVKYTSDGFKLVFGESLRGNHRVGNDYIYDVMFKKGFHGGAPHNGDYYWRYPGPQAAASLGIPPYITWYPWGAAPISSSPWEYMKSEWAAYTNGEGKKILLNAVLSEFAKIIKEVS